MNKIKEIIDEFDPLNLLAGQQLPSDEFVAEAKMIYESLEKMENIQPVTVLLLVMNVFQEMFGSETLSEADIKVLFCIYEKIFEIYKNKLTI